MRYLNTFSKREKIIVLILIAVIGFSIITFSYLLNLAKKEVPPPISGEGPEIISPQQLELEAGEVGEILVKDEKTGEEGPLISSIFPPIIFNTTGIIEEIKEDRLIVKGSGTNFADGLPRTLIVIFISETFTINKGKNLQWKGFSGLKQLKPEMEILIDGLENIRGKTEFKTRTINIL